MGPIALFDKSFLESLNPDEAVLFDMLFMPVISPLFLVETLADLSKVRAGRTPEQLVGNIAYKTPVYSGAVNMYHASICSIELSGRAIEMRHVPVVDGGKEVETEGGRGVYMKPPPEQEAVDRWMNGKFEEVERGFARHWRANASRPIKEFNSIQLNASARSNFATLSDVWSASKKGVDNPATKWPKIYALSEMAGLGRKKEWLLIKRWVNAGMPPIRQFVPYCAHALDIELFFGLGVAAGLIPSERPTNRIDAAYLHYVPFAQIFISSDRLHETLAPVVMDANQRFVWGQDLKADLTRLVTHFKAHPDIDTAGLAMVANGPPRDDTGVIATLWDRYLPEWRKTPVFKKKEITPEERAAHKEILDRMKGL